MDLKYRLYGPMPYIVKMELPWTHLITFPWPYLIAILYVYLHLCVLGSVGVAHF